MADDKDLRLVPIKEKGGFALVPDRWKVDYFVSAGELTPFYEGLIEGKLMGTRCPSCGSVYFWPRGWCHDCYEDCEWVEMSGKAELILSSRADISLIDFQESPFVQGSVKLEGARYATVVMMRIEDYDSMRPGMRMRVEFKPKEERIGRTRDFYFVPDE